MKQYSVTINNTILNEERTVKVKAADPMTAHKDTLWDLSEYDEIIEIRNSNNILVYGSEGFVNALRDKETK